MRVSQGNKIVAIARVPHESEEEQEIHEEDEQEEESPEDTAET